MRFKVKTYRICFAFVNEGYPPISYRPGDVKGQTPETVKHKGDVTYSANSKSNGLSTGYQENGFEQKTSASFDVPRKYKHTITSKFHWLFHLIVKYFTYVNQLKQLFYKIKNHIFQYARQHCN